MLGISGTLDRRFSIFTHFLRFIPCLLRYNHKLRILIRWQYPPIHRHTLIISTAFGSLSAIIGNVPHINRIPEYLSNRACLPLCNRCRNIFFIQYLGNLKITVIIIDRIVIYFLYDLFLFLVDYQSFQSSAMIADLSRILQSVTKRSTSSHKLSCPGKCFLCIFYSRTGLSTFAFCLPEPYVV